jgi:hypothetical protein
MGKERKVRWFIHALSVFYIAFIITSSNSILADSLSTPDSWSTPVKISSDADFTHFDGGFDVGGAGDAFVIWRPISEWTSDHGYRTSPSIMASHFNHSTGWSDPEKISDGYARRDMDVAADDYGNAIAVWLEDISQDEMTIFANRFVNGTGWSGQVPISEPYSYLIDPNIEMDGHGNAWVVWISHSPGPDGYWMRSACYFASPMDNDAAWGWGMPMNISSEIAIAYSGLELEVSSDGYAIAGWSILDNRSVAIVNRYIPGVGWLGEERISNDQVNASWGKIAIRDGGSAICAWQEYNETQNSVFISTLKETKWGTPFRVVSYSSSAIEFVNARAIGFLSNEEVMLLVGGTYNNTRDDLTDFRVDYPSGLVTDQEVVWNNYTRAEAIESGRAMIIGIIDEDQLSSREFVAGYGWNQPVTCIHEDPATIFDLRIGIDSSGNAVIVHSIFGPRVFDLMGSSYSDETESPSGNIPIEAIIGVSVVILAVGVGAAIWYLRKSR